MVRTPLYTRHLPKLKADALNRESGWVYFNTLACHYSAYHHTGHWSAVGADCRLKDHPEYHPGSVEHHPLLLVSLIGPRKYRKQTVRFVQGRLSE